MSKIMAELSASVETPRKRGESDADLFKRIMVAISELPDDAWEALSPAAQQYYNTAADAANKKADIPAPPDAEAPAAAAEAPATGRRRGAAAAAPAEPKVGDQVIAVNKRGKTFEGELVEMDDEVLVIALADGSEEELNRSRLESVTVKGKPEPAPAPAAPAEPKVGDQVIVINKRDKETTGKLVEMDDEVLVVETANGAEVEIDRDRVKSIAVVGTKPGRAAAKSEAPAAAAEAPATGRRRGAAAAAETEPAAEEKPARAGRTQNGGVSVTGRVRDLLAANLDMKLEEVAKKLKAEGLEFRENTLQLTYAEFFKVVASLRAAGAMD